MKGQNIVCGTLLWVLLDMGTAQAAVAQVRFGGWSLRANHQVAQHFEYTGSCPVDLTFDWGLMSTEPTEAHYTLTRNDGGHTGGKSVQIPHANQSVSVTDEWRLGANSPAFASFHGWVEMNIESPNHVSHKIAFTLHCK